MKKRLVIGNWKMYIESPDEGKKMAQALKRKAAKFKGVEVWVAAPFTILPALKGTVKAGVQTVSAWAEGAHTGEVSSAMARGAGASFVIIGHSERRQLFAERDEAFAFYAYWSPNALASQITALSGRGRKTPVRPRLQA